MLQLALQRTLVVHPLIEFTPHPVRLVEQLKAEPPATAACPSTATSMRALSSSSAGTSHARSHPLSSETGCWPRPVAARPAATSLSPPVPENSTRQSVPSRPPYQRQPRNHKPPAQAAPGQPATLRRRGANDSISRVRSFAPHLHHAHVEAALTCCTAVCNQPSLCAVSHNCSLKSRNPYSLSLELHRHHLIGMRPLPCCVTCKRKLKRHVGLSAWRSSPHGPQRPARSACPVTADSAC